MIALKESKICDMDTKKEFEVYFVESNAVAVIARLSKAQKTSALPGMRSPPKQKRKTSRYRS